MPAIAKPCEGHFSEETVASLLVNNDRAQWLPQICAQCGQSVGAILEKGKWTPEKHWPSVHYVPRTKRVEKRKVPEAAQPQLTT